MEIPEIKLKPFPETEEAKKAFGFKYNDEVGYRHKIGGKPDKVNIEDFPKCSCCENVMTFYAQIDSIGSNYNLADCMVIHQFVCFDCFTVDCQLNQI